MLVEISADLGGRDTELAFPKGALARPSGPAVGLELGPGRVLEVGAVDENGILWLATNNGLVRLDPATGNITAFYPSDFDLPPGTHFNTVFIDADGVKSIGTEEGVVQYAGA